MVITEKIANGMPNRFIGWPKICGINLSSFLYYYDGNGNLTAYGTGSFAATYAYDIENRLSTAEPASGGNQVFYGDDRCNIS
jgi:hypothetical protein